MVFLQGFHAFPGGQRDEAGGGVKSSRGRPERAALIACAARELLRDGVMARAARLPDDGAARRGRDDLSRPDVFRREAQTLRAAARPRDFTFAGRWSRRPSATPLRPRSFPRALPAQEGAARALRRVQRGRVDGRARRARALATGRGAGVTPVIPPEELEGGSTKTWSVVSSPCRRRTESPSAEEFLPACRFPLRTPTNRPPTTNCYASARAISCHNPGSPYETAGRVR